MSGQKSNEENPNGIRQVPFVVTLIELIKRFVLKLINGKPDSDDDLYEKVCRKVNGFLLKLTDQEQLDTLFEMNLPEISYTWDEIMSDCRKIQNFFLDTLWCDPTWKPCYKNLREIFVLIWSRTNTPFVDNIVVSHNVLETEAQKSMEKDGSATGGQLDAFQESLIEGLSLNDPVYMAAFLNSPLVHDARYAAFFSRVRAHAEEAAGVAPGGVHGSAPGEVQVPEAQDP